MRQCPDCRNWRNDQRETENLLHSVAAHPVPARLEEAVRQAVATVDGAGASHELLQRKWRKLALGGAGALVALIVGGVVVVRSDSAAAELARARSNLVQAPYAHYTELSWRLGPKGEWVLQSESEGWQAHGKQWLVLRGGNRAMYYAFWPGAGKKSVWYTPRTHQLRRGSTGPLLFIWDWEHMLQSTVHHGKVERLGERVWHGKKVRVYRLTVAEQSSQSMQQFFVDRESGLMVHEEGTAETVKPEKETLRAERNVDYREFDPRTLFDPEKMARQPQAEGTPTK